MRINANKKKRKETCSPRKGQFPSQLQAARLDLPAATEQLIPWQVSSMKIEVGIKGKNREDAYHMIVTKMKTMMMAEASRRKRRRSVRQSTSWNWSCQGILYSTIHWQRTKGEDVKDVSKLLKKKKMKRPSFRITTYYERNWWRSHVLHNK